MNTFVALLTGAGVGAGVMYALDPQLGRRRRAMAQDKLVRATKKTKEAAFVTVRDLKNRTLGVMAEGRSRCFESDITDEALEGRVRSKLGFLVRHPSAIEARVADGRVLLTGPVLSDEVEQLIAGIRSVRGVREVENGLEVHTEPGDIPGLQGDKPKPTGQPIDILQRRWSPSTRFLIGAAGAALLLYSATQSEKTAAGLPALLAAGLLAYSFGDGNMVSGSARPQKQSKRSANQEEITAGWGA